MRIFAKESFKVERMKKGYSVANLAKEVGMSTQGLKQVDSRINGISPERSQDILDVLQVEFDDVFELIDRN